MFPQVSRLLELFCGFYYLTVKNAIGLAECAAIPKQVNRVQRKVSNHNFSLKNKKDYFFPSNEENLAQQVMPQDASQLLLVTSGWAAGQ